MPPPSVVKSQSKLADSAAEKTILKASCLCGAPNHEVTLSTSDLPLKGYMCHCTSCRRMTGAQCLTVVFCPEYYQPAQSVLDKMTAYVFTKRITQYFCTTCGCQMLARCLEDGDDPNSTVTWDVATGTLERIEDIVDWQGHEHLQDTLDGGFADFLTEINGKKLERWPAHYGKHEQVPPGWTSTSRSEVEASPSDKLHCTCRCGGVEFYVTRPSARSALAEKYWPESPPLDISNEQLPPESETFYMRDNRTKFLAGLCSCNSCRLAAGVEITTWAFIPAFQITQDKEGKIPWSGDFGTLRKYESSPGCYRYFCSRCGAIVFYDADGREFLKDVAVGLVDAPEGSRAESWFGWRTRRLGYRDDDIPRAESFVLAIEKGLREWEASRPGADLSGGSRSGGAL
ncbi:hypothetical protein M409DRAFT_53837 [Zasmidium cellare ATCC 36951]|uniref:CENP-V/GFA domain-containing protein n=1 Tax=Zasmidium cellare ATCC 36951 TaxID=1080233 RepID=A0A6A6CKV8_ZASCE|nr:uncharacterized protein M409DRAFT_53837 [Zasmidium cellare ATCC 36951]KAF2167887.1 hypothetical protein M409DRAFT_53837 [Zasmidium cellare ATCC 36951]